MSNVVAGARTITDELVALSDTGQVLAVAVDLADADAPAELVSRAAHFGGLDILVNNVGAVTPRTTGFLDVSDDDWHSTLNLTLMAAVRTTRAAIPLLLERGAGTVVTICSVNAYLPDPGVIDYSATKAAVWNLSKSLSKEFGPRGPALQHRQPGTGLDAALARRERRRGHGRGEHGRLVRRGPARGSSRARAASRPAASPSRRRSPTSSCCWPATARATSRAPTSSSTAASPSSSDHHPSEGAPMSRTPVVFIHGLWIHSSAWAPWLELFAARGYDAERAGLAR